MFPLKHGLIGLYGIGISGLLTCWLVEDNNEKDYSIKPVSASHNFTSERSKECGESSIWKSDSEFNKKNSKGKNFWEWTSCTTRMIGKHFSQSEIQKNPKTVKNKSTVQDPRSGRRSTRRMISRP